MKTWNNATRCLSIVHALGSGVSPHFLTALLIGMLMQVRVLRQVTARLHARRFLCNKLAEGLPVEISVSRVG